MTDTKHKFYIKTDRTAKVSFEITAKRFIENYAPLKKKSYFLFSQLQSRKITQFEQATLYLKDSHIHFKRGYWSQGKLVLEGASGAINQQKFTTPKLIFNKSTMAVTAKKITLIAPKKISRKLNYHQQVTAVSLPYKQVPFISSRVWNDE